MDKILAVIERLRAKNYQPEIIKGSNNNVEWTEILWTDETNDNCIIYDYDIAFDEYRLAWLQTSEESYNHLLKVYEQGIEFSWTPKTYNPFFGCKCLLLEWYNDHLIFIYQEKHGIYICSITDQKVNSFYFHGEEIERKENLISYETYMNRLTDKVRLIKIPELVELEPIDKKEAEKLGLLPSGLNRPGNFLSLK